MRTVKKTHSIAADARDIFARNSLARRGSVLLLAALFSAVAMLMVTDELAQFFTQVSTALCACGGMLSLAIASERPTADDRPLSYEKGAAARHLGRPRSASPFRSGSDDRAQWDLGWNEGM
jgi:hypothetical protein